MAVDEYLNLKKQVKKEEDTRDYFLSKAWLAAVDTTVDNNGMADLSKFEEQIPQQTGIDAFYKSLADSVKIKFKSAADDIFSIAQMIHGVCGISKGYLTQYFKSGQVNHNSFFSNLQENKEYVNTSKSLRSIPYQALETTESGINTILEYVGITEPEKQAKVRPKVSDPRALAQIIDIYDANGGLPPKTLEKLLAS